MSGFQERLDAVRERIAAACGRAGRDPSSVALLPVTKTVPPPRIREAADCGLAVFGESRVQEARQKIPLCPAALEWHFIGHVQTNKAREAVRLFSTLHAVDSVHLLEVLDQACGQAGVTRRVLLQVNNSGEASKSGVKPEDAPALLGAAERCLRLEVAGLMTIPPASRDPADARPFFQALRELRDRLRADTGFDLPELSMGMSSDFEIAVEEGATWVRLGSALFGARQPDPEA